jgi:acetyl-CoA carboxylase biotin carboxyl carrier protein
VAHVRAPITGVVWQVLVAEGDTIAVDQTVIVLESMKLEIPVDAESAGTVARILVAEGDAVTEDQVLIELA